MNRVEHYEFDDPEFLQTLIARIHYCLDALSRDRQLHSMEAYIWSWTRLCAHETRPAPSDVTVPE